MAKPEELSPACPYKGFFAILSEGDAVTAVEDQVLKLGPDFDRSSLTTLYRLLWLLNDTTHHKTFQGYIRFGKRPAQKPFGLFLEILLSPLYPGTGQFIIGLEAIMEMASEFSSRLAVATASLDDRQNCSICLAPIRTKFGVPPDTTWGYALRLRAEAFEDSTQGAITKWKELVGLMATAFEKP